MTRSILKPAHIVPGHESGVSSDRLTQALIWMAILLTAVLAAVGSDFLWRPSVDATSVQAAGSSPELTVPTTPPMPTASSTNVVTVAVTAAVSISSTEVPQVAITPPACVPPDDWGIHVVQQGNTLYSLARRYGTTVEALTWVNCLNTDTIFIGQRLYVPGPSVSPTAPLPAVTPRPEEQPRITAQVDASSAASASPGPTPAPEGPNIQSALKLNIPGHYLNIVLLGSDKRPRSGAWRTDSMIVVSVDTERNIVRLLSLPRDLWVYIPGHGYNRINTADLWGELARKGGGPERVKQTIYYNLGIPIHYYVRVDFQGFIDIIDTVGGVEIDVDCPLPDIKLTAGVHQMNGKQALRFARSRKSTNDFDRGRRQRKVLMALWEQALNLDIIPKLPILWRTMAGSYQTDLPLDQVINLAYVGAQLKPQHILSRSIGPSEVQSWMTPEGAAVLLPRQDRIKSVLEKFYAIKDLSGLDAAEKVSVRVLNGSPRKDAEQLASAALRWGGFKVVAASRADRRDHAQTQILVYSGDLAHGEQVASQLGVPPTAVQDRTGQEQPDPGHPVDVQIILGRDYDPCQR